MTFCFGHITVRRLQHEWTTVKKNEIANLKSVDIAVKLQQHSTTETDL